MLCRSKRHVIRNQGHCPICEKKVWFKSKYDWLRDHYLCSNCGSIPRERALMYAIKSYYPNFRDLAIHESSPAARGTSVKLAKECYRYLASQYNPEITFGENHPSLGYRSEDLENMTFDDAVFDLVITQDVLEHLFHPEKAFSEIARILKPGGAHIFTVPLVNKLKPSEKWAELSDNGEVNYLHEAEYHGNPIDRNGSLVTMHWGYDICEFVQESSGLFTTILMIDNIEMGIRAEYIEVLISFKPEKF